MKLAIAILAFLCTPASAKLLRVPFEGIRPLGMGNAFIALADDANMLWYNPAGLARVKKPHVNLIDLSTTFESADTFDRMKKALLNNEYQSVLRSDTQFMGLGTRPSFIMPYFGFGIFNNLTSFSDIRALASLDASVDIYFRNDMGMLLAFAIPFTKYFSAGVSAKIIHRISADLTITGHELLERVQASQGDFLESIYTNIQDLTGTGYALGANVGVLAELPLGPKFPRIRLAATIEDIGVTTFRKFGTLPNPPAIPQTYHGGVAVTYSLAKDLEWNITFDARNCFERMHWTKMAHLGSELRHKLVGVRAGLYQGYLAYGLSLEFAPHTRLHFASVSSELGDGFRERGLRWYVVQMTLGFNPL